MPQMAPMSWVLLLLTFSILLIITMMLNYYLYTPKIKTNLTKFMSNSQLVWKW